MSIDSSVVPEIKIPSPDGLYLDLYTGELTNIDTRVDVQSVQSYSGLVYDRSYPPTYNVMDGILYPSPGHNVKSGWDGVVDSLQTYPGLVYDRSYPPTYNIKDGILYPSPGHNVIDSAADTQWIEVDGVYMNDIANPTDTSTEPSDLKNIKSNIRKIKPDINSDLKRV